MRKERKQKGREKVRKDEGKQERNVQSKANEMNKEERG
jgi:hypothetical protein